ncbi:hypothetical protein CXG45_24140 [Pseudomonas plecoglossicida]|uniref:Uncharacterized protein n=1 Tax=Pseudomonas plecoglossicida TaxID=70775 RepID=A0ABX4TY90_PSEDL|nr:hypothetical protein CXG44_21320 [Pseudomonas plecoglossicida]PPB16723.1 hypothetical protein HV87_19460 [Pseudomonas aeruginosa]QDR68343.1 hypothetical protein FPB55_12095 [Pseudomonas sp. BJP69]PLU90270.1 hypothetical protein CXG45_24140 [Pseudomonas plecoglossicida]PLV02683.1 hypothetical protein CXG48_15350 [Pseudomonas plecoglossicida]
MISKRLQLAEQALHSIGGLYEVKCQARHMPPCRCPEWNRRTGGKRLILREARREDRWVWG